MFTSQAFEVIVQILRYCSNYVAQLGFILTLYTLNTLDPCPCKPNWQKASAAVIIRSGIKKRKEILR
jgi:hypothetical protein